MKYFICFFLLSLHAYAYIDLPKEGETLYRAHFFTTSEEDPDDPFLTPDQSQYCFDHFTEFEELPLEDWEKQVIAFIVTEMAEKNVFQLLLEKNEMERKGRKINHVHPLRFIGHVCSDSKLIKAMKVIRKNIFKWESFINGFGRRVKEEHDRGNFLRFLPSFSRYLQVDEAEVTSYFSEGDHEGAVRYLISG